MPVTAPQCISTPSLPCITNRNKLYSSHDIAPLSPPTVPFFLLAPSPQYPVIQVSVNNFLWRVKRLSRAFNFCLFVAAVAGGGRLFPTFPYFHSVYLWRSFFLSMCALCDKNADCGGRRQGGEPFFSPLHVHPTVGFTLPASSSLFVECFRVIVAFVEEGGAHAPSCYYTIICKVERVPKG